MNLKVECSLIAAIWHEHKGIGSTCNLFVACHALVAA